ncbi:hypothetical protein SAMN04488570_0281 [Nocardioides scoriae]|uniref:Replication initiation protein n=1 Tax=Nocardioides scoriae TaxID=642780 RepID=A0A1H1LMB9_9ACTN|nr:replication initiator [Nocardioides scoriae]SDR75673.1 hypothetical protein SAMN04488570_0281 [Nocardioides scoriae]
MRLRGQRNLVDTRTGEITTLYDSASELDGQVYVRCGDRRARVCPSCSREYKGDAWHLLLCGLAGGKGVPADVAKRPCTFLTLTAPSFGPVHGTRGGGPCRPRRDHPRCPHGRPMWCHRRHDKHDRSVGEPLCEDCYDYVGHVLWQWHAPELWRRFCIALQRELAKVVGLRVSDFRKACRISYSKVVEFQARGVVHFHAPIRLDGPEGPHGPRCDLSLDTDDLERAIVVAAGRVALESELLVDGGSRELKWGAQIDLRSISGAVARNSDRAARVVHPEQVAAYLAKYLTKTTEDFGLPARVRTPGQARAGGASPHAVNLVRAACWLSGQHEAYRRMQLCLATLAYRGHPITKSRAYSVTFGQLRLARKMHRGSRGTAPQEVHPLVADDAPTGFEVVSSFVYVGRGIPLLMARSRAGPGVEWDAA